jgi:hypothetical protein
MSASQAERRGFESHRPLLKSINRFSPRTRFLGFIVASYHMRQAVKLYRSHMEKDAEVTDR